jgi:hypothetical protein
MRLGADEKQSSAILFAALNVSLLGKRIDNGGIDRLQVAIRSAFAPTTRGLVPNL